MPKRILVPLDRTPLAEALVPIAAALAQGAGAVVRLVHVAPEPQSILDTNGRIVIYADQERASFESAGMDYLRLMEEQFRLSPVDSVVRFGDPVTEVLGEAESFDADLIVVSSAGRSAIRREVFGSVAEDLLRRAPCPVFLYSARLTRP